LSTNLHRRGATYYVRVATPRTLQELRQSRTGHRGRREVWRSLRTQSLAQARALQPRAMEAIYREFEAESRALLAGGAVALSDPSDEDIQSLAFEFKKREIQLDEIERLHRPSSAAKERKLAEVRANLAAQPGWSPLQQLTESGFLELQNMQEAKESAAEKRQHLAAALRQSLDHNDFHLVDWAIREAALRRHWRVSEGDLAYRKLGRHLLKAWLSALDSANARDRGDYGELDERVIVPIAQSGHARNQTAVAKGEGLQDYFETYLKERHADVSASGMRDRRATIRQFVQLSGNKHVTAYRKSDVTAYKRLLTQLPARVEKLYPGIPVAKAVELNRKDGHPALKSSSIRNKLSTLSAFGKWLEENVDGVDAGSFQTSLPSRSDVARMEPFSSEQIVAILNAGAFTGCRSEKSQQELGDHKVRDWRYWLTLMLAFTGARLNEVVQLRVKDLQQVEGIWVIDFTNEGEGQSLKTSSSRRQLPIHPRLLELGILAFRDEAARVGQEDLFHKVPRDRDGRHSTQAGKWFRKFLVRIGVKGQDIGGAHRWRHTLADALRRGGVEDFDIGRLLGHDVNVAKMTGHYGREVDMSLNSKLALLSKADYPQVDFARLR
jgi:integrase